MRSWKPYFLLLPLLLSVAFPLTGLPQGRSPAKDVEIPDWTQYQNMAVRLFREYLRIDTSNPPGNELLAADFFHRIFSANGIPNTIYPISPTRGDIYAVLKGDGSLPPLILLNHMDVVRAVPAEWRFPPFFGDLVDGLVYGRGALDMKDIGLLQAMVLIIASREHLHLKRDVIFLGTADEEVGDLGTTWFLAHHADLLNHAAYLLTEGGTAVSTPGQATLLGIDVAEKAPLWIRITAKGKGGHGSIPIPDSAPDQLVEAMNRVVQWQPPLRLLPLVEEYFRRIGPLQTEPLRTQFLHIRDSLQDPRVRGALARNSTFSYLLRDTVTLTVMQAGEQTNVIPGTASAELDVRLLPGDDPQVFLSQLREVVDDPELNIEPLAPFRKPNSSSTSTMLYRVIEKVIRQNYPQAVVAPQLNSGYTESQMFRPRGITAYGFNPVITTPEIEETQHAANERVPIDAFRQGLKILFEVVASAANQ